MTPIDIDTARMVAEAVGKHAAAFKNLDAVRSRRNQLPGYGADHLTAIADQGWLAAFVPEDAGGMGLGVDAAAILSEGLAPAFAVSPLDSYFLAARVMTHAHVDPEVLGRLCDGEATPAFAWQERADDVFDPRSATTTLVDGRITGCKSFVLGHASARQFVVTAQGEAGLVLGVIDADAEGLSTKTHWRADGTPIGTLQLDSVPCEIICSDPVALLNAIAQGVDETNLMVASELMAHIDAVMSMTLEHMRTRIQFGKPIGAFQALQHRVVDLYIQQVLSRSVLDPAIAKMAAGLPGDQRSLLVSRVRSRLNTTGRLVAREAIQLFGAMGITDECDLSLHVKRILSLTSWLGTAAQHRARFAQSLIEKHTNSTDKEIPA